MGKSLKSSYGIPFWVMTIGSTLGVFSIAEEPPDKILKPLSEPIQISPDVSPAVLNVPAPLSGNPLLASKRNILSSEKLPIVLL